MTAAISRRSLLKSAAQLGTAAVAGPSGLDWLLSAGKIAAGSESPTAAAELLPVAAIVTEYRDNSHADVILGKILNGFDQRGGANSALKLVGLFTDQTPTGDLSRSLADKYRFRIATSIDDALTLGTDRLQVAGVLSIGEHGAYPATPETGQVMYPRRRFFDGIVACFRRVGQVVPVFNDKHLSYRWADARYMVDVAAELKFPFMAGSSLPVTWRHPALDLPIGCRIESACAVGYGPIEAYGFHALETLQCMVERRSGGETGIKAVQALRGGEIDAARARGEWSEELFNAALRTIPGSPLGDLKRLDNTAVFFQLEYLDGLRATVAMANGIAAHFAFAARLRDRPEPAAAWFELEDDKPFGHFAYLLRAIDHMFRSGKPAYPVERTLLTTGVLDAAMHSLANQGRRRETPELNLKYQSAVWPFAVRK